MQLSFCDCKLKESCRKGTSIYWYSPTALLKPSLALCLFTHSRYPISLLGCVLTVFWKSHYVLCSPLQPKRSAFQDNLQSSQEAFPLCLGSIPLESFMVWNSFSALLRQNNLFNKVSSEKKNKHISCIAPLELSCTEAEKRSFQVSPEILVWNLWNSTSVCTSIYLCCTSFSSLQVLHHRRFLSLLLLLWLAASLLR